MVPAKQRAEQRVVGIADLFSKVREIADQEQREVSRITRTMLPVLAWLKAPVVLRPEALGEGFAGFRSVSLQAGAVVVTTDSQGRASSKPISAYPPRDCLAILREAFPELQRMVVDRRRGKEVRPVLEVKSMLKGSRRIVDMRSYLLILTNSGGDCHALRVSFDVDGETRVSKPSDLGHGERVELDLGLGASKAVKELDRLGIHVDCTDVDGRALQADAEVRLDSQKWAGIPLGAKRA